MNKLTIHYPDDLKVKRIILEVVKNNKSDEEPEQKTVAELAEDEVAYTLPWSLAAFSFGFWGINKNYPVSPKEEGNSTMKIQRKNGCILVESGTVQDGLITPWGFERCLQAKLVKQIINTPDQIRIIIF